MKLINVKTVCDECGAVLINGEYEVYLIDSEKSTFLHLCNDCSNKRIESIRRMLHISEGVEK